MRAASDFLKDDTVVEATLPAPAPLGTVTMKRTLGATKREDLSAAALHEASGQAVKARAWADAKALAVLAVAKMSPRDAQTLNDAAWTLVDRLPADQRDARLALPWVEEAVTLTKSKEGPILDTLAVALYQCGRVVEAAEKAKEAAALQPGNKNIAARAKAYATEAAAKSGAGVPPP